MQEINREFMVKDQYTEPYHPQQNLVESSAIRYLKGQTHVLLDMTGAPDSLWFMALQYTADIHNICADTNLPNEMTPLQYQQESLQTYLHTYSLPFGNLYCTWITKQCGLLLRKGLVDGWE